MTETERNIFDSCNLLADYSQVASDPILPFLVTLNLTASRLAPAAGESQRFCYDVTGVGGEGGGFADLTRLVLGICEEISPREIAGISVTIDGEEQEVDFGPGGNVILRQTEGPGPDNGRAGLAFYFPLAREDSQMQVCFELAEPRPVGAVSVALSGGGVTLNGLDICGPVCEQPDQPLVVYYRADVCAPVSVIPYAMTGDPVVTACGAPEITLGDDCGGGGDCGFTVRQRLCVAVPVEFGARAEARRVSTECLGAGGAMTCAGCGDGDGPDEDDGVINRPADC